MTPLWTEDISILYEKRYIFEVLPSKKFDFNRKLNSLLRLSIYYSLIMFFLDRSNTNVIYIPLIVWFKISEDINDLVGKVSRKIGVLFTN